MKGLECGTGDRLTQVFRSEVTQPVSVAVWWAPGHVEDFTAGVPNCMVVDSDDRTVVDFIVETMSTDLIRLYKGGDLVGNRGWSRGEKMWDRHCGGHAGRQRPFQLERFTDGAGRAGDCAAHRAMGGNELSAYGLCHLGDYEATLFSSHSHNRQFERAISKVSRTEALPKACPLCAPWWNWGRYGVELPICNTIYAILYEEADADAALRTLITRSVKGEFDS